MEHIGLKKRRVLAILLACLLVAGQVAMAAAVPEGMICIHVQGKNPAECEACLALIAQQAAGGQPGPQPAGNPAGGGQPPVIKEGPKTEPSQEQAKPEPGQETKPAPKEEKTTLQSTKETVDQGSQKTDETAAEKKGKTTEVTTPTGDGKTEGQTGTEGGSKEGVPAETESGGKEGAQTETNGDGKEGGKTETEGDGKEDGKTVTEGDGKEVSQTGGTPDPEKKNEGTPPEGISTQPGITEGGEQGQTDPAIVLNVTNLSAEPQTAEIGKTITLTATLAGLAEGKAPAGQVVFSVGGNILNAAISGSTASTSWQSETAGEVSVAARYSPAASGDSYTAGTGANGTITVTETAPNPEDEGKTPEDPAKADPEATEGDPEAGAPEVSNLLAAAAAAQLNIADAQVSVSGAYTYNGKEQQPTLVVVLNNRVLSYGTDYTFMEVKDNTNAGTAQFKIGGLSSYVGEKSGTFTISPASASAWQVTLSQTSFLYNAGVTQTPTVTAITGLGGESIATGDVDIAYPSPSIEAGNYNVTVTAKASGNYTGSTQVGYTIAAAKEQLTAANTKVTWQAPDYTQNNLPYYVSTGTEVKPTVSVRMTNPAKTLTQGVDFDVVYTGGPGAGNYSATIKGKGNYEETTGIPAYQYVVVNNPSTSLSVSVPAATYAYRGTPYTPGVTVKNAAGQVVTNNNYTVAYSNNVNVGTATVTVTGTNQYAGLTATTTFEISKRSTTMSFKIDKNADYLLVTARIAGAVHITGDVAFSVTINGQTSQYSAALNAYGEATVAIPMKGTGTYKIDGSYPGDANHGGCTATTSSSSSNAHVNVTVSETGPNGEYVTARIAVTGGWNGVIPTGSVALIVDGRNVVTLPLDRNGMASYTFWNYSTWGTQQILVVEYLGDGYYSPATSAPISLWNQYKRVPIIKLETSVGSGSKPTILNVEVSGSNWYDLPTGSVSFYNGEKLLGTVRLNRYGQASFTWEKVPSGKHTVYAVYSGNDVFRGGTASAQVRKGSSSSGGGSSSGTTRPSVTPTPAPIRNDAEILFYDARGTVQKTYNTQNMTMPSGGILTIEAGVASDFYSFGVTLSRLRTLSSNTNGYFNIVTPNFNVQLPYSMVEGMENLSGYLQQKGLSESQVEMRLNLRKISDSSLEASFRSTYPNGTFKIAYSVDVELYQIATGTKLDYIPASIEAPLKLLLPVDTGTGFAVAYSPQTRQFQETAVEFSASAASVSVFSNAIYIIAQ